NTGTVPLATTARSCTSSRVRQSMAKRTEPAIALARAATRAASSASTVSGGAGGSATRRASSSANASLQGCAREINRGTARSAARNSAPAHRFVAALRVLLRRGGLGLIGDCVVTQRALEQQRAHVGRQRQAGPCHQLGLGRAQRVRRCLAGDQR